MAVTHWTRQLGAHPVGHTEAWAGHSNAYVSQNQVYQRSDLKPLSISIDGSAHEIHIALTFEAPSSSTRDWLVGATLFHQGQKVPTDEVGWNYSGAADINFAYLEISHEAPIFIPRPIKSKGRFDEVRLTLIPWSKEARAAQSPPVVRTCRYAIKSQNLSGENIQIETHALGEITFSGAS